MQMNSSLFPFTHCYSIIEYTKANIVFEGSGESTEYSPCHQLSLVVQSPKSTYITMEFITTYELSIYSGGDVNVN